MELLALSLHLNYGLSTETVERLDRWDEVMRAEPPLHPIRWHMYLEHYLRSATVTASTEIEGNPLTLSQVDALLQGEAVDAPARARQEVLNYNGALSTATSLALAPTFAWSQAILRMLNHQVMREDANDRQGRYRDEQVHVAGVYRPPTHPHVEGLMSTLEEWLRVSTDRPLVRVALLHLNLVAIHPRLDGNGRTARVASSLELMRSGVGAPELVSVEPYLREHRDEYFERLRTTLGPTYDPERHTATEWVEYYVRVSSERLTFGERMNGAWPQDVGTVVEALAGSGCPSEWGIISLMAAISPIRTRQVAENISRTMPTARTMLSAMTSEGWLERHGRRRGTFYQAGPRLQALSLRTPEIVRQYVEGQTLGLEVDGA